MKVISEQQWQKRYRLYEKTYKEYAKKPGVSIRTPLQEYGIAWKRNINTMKPGRGGRGYIELVKIQAAPLSANQWAAIDNAISSGSKEKIIAELEAEGIKDQFQGIEDWDGATLKANYNLLIDALYKSYDLKSDTIIASELIGETFYGS